MILDRSVYRHQLKALLDEVKKRGYHPYVSHYIRYPGINLFQLHFLYLFLKDQGLSPDERNHYCISQMLIQLGLDSHDDVSNEQLSQSDQFKARQLKILIGDYFSGHYYHYLAEHHQVELIHKWATVVKTVNEEKLRLYTERNRLPHDQIINMEQKIRRYVTESVLRWFDADQIWFDILHNYVFITISSGRDLNSTEMLEEAMEKLKRAVDQLPNSLIRAEIDLWMDKIEEEELLIGSHG